MNIPSTTSALRRVRMPAYLIFSLVGLYEFVDVILALRPFNFGVPTWRFSAVGVASNAFGRPLTMLVLLFAVAAISMDRKTMRVIAGVAGLGVLIFLGLLLDFTLGALQIRSQVPAAETRKFIIATGVAAMKLMTFGFATALLAYSAFKAAAGGAAAASTKPTNVIVPGADPSRVRSSAPDVGATTSR